MPTKKVTVKMTATDRVPWRETRWGTHPHYHCRKCRFDTHDKTAMAEHAAAKHPEEEA